MVRWGIRMRFSVVSGAAVLFLSMQCMVGQSPPSELFDIPVRAGHDFPRLLQKANDGNAEAQFQLGLVYETGSDGGQDYAEAAQWYRKAADAGYPGAQNNLGGLYLRGLGVEQSNAEAMKWYLRAATQGHRAAENNVGYMYATGRDGVRPREATLADQVEAVKWYRRAAKTGYPAAEFNLGFAYFRGVGVSKDLAEAIRWLFKAAGHGSAAAENLIGFAYERGLGVRQDYNAASSWYRRAVANGSAEARNNLISLDAITHKSTQRDAPIAKKSLVNSNGGNRIANLIPQ